MNAERVKYTDGIGLERCNACLAVWDECTCPRAVPCERAGCPALATHGRLCAAHASTATRAGKVLTCAQCGQDIKTGAWMKSTPAGPVHAGYQCQPTEAQGDFKP